MIPFRLWSRRIKRGRREILKWNRENKRLKSREIQRGIKRKRVVDKMKNKRRMRSKTMRGVQRIKNREYLRMNNIVKIVKMRKLVMQRRLMIRKRRMMKRSKRKNKISCMIIRMMIRKKRASRDIRSRHQKLYNTKQNRIQIKNKLKRNWQINNIKINMFRIRYRNRQIKQKKNLIKINKKKKKYKN